MASVLAVLGGLLAVAAIVLLIPVGVVFVQVVAARARSVPAAAQAGPRPSAVVLMPAHDEASGIATAIEAALRQLRSTDRLLVVADNCSDDTASVAAACGAHVIERRDAQRRGKGYALDHGVRCIAAAPPDVVVIVDADCIVHEGGLDRLVRECADSGRPVQALYLMQSPPGAGLRTRMAQFAWAVRNHARPLGYHRLGLPCQLMGTGMAFPWNLIADAPLASGHIVEDMALGLDLAAIGSPPQFCPDALVTSCFPESDEGSAAQRTRWEHGHLSTMATRGLPLLWRAAASGQATLAAMAFDLCVPPLAALVLMLTLAALLTGAWAGAGGSALPLGIVLLAMALLVLAIAIAWRRFARHIVSLRELLSIPFYVAAKIPIYVRLFTARQVAWVRTKRGS